MSNGQHEQQKEWGKKESFNLLCLVMTALTACVNPLLHEGMGVEYPGLPGLIGLGIVVAVGGFAAEPLMFAYLLLLLTFLLIRRLEAWKLDKAGRIEHSRYTGTPLLTRWFGVSEMTAKCAIEPFLVLVTGALLYQVSEALGGFLMTCAAALLFSLGIEREINRRRVQAMQDAQIEHEYLAAQQRRRP